MNRKKKLKLRLALYVRVSHEEQAKHGYSLAAQKETLKEWAEKNGHTIAGWYIDEGVSARKLVKRRPQMQRMLKDVQAGDIDMIIFIKLDRYFRSVAEYHATQTILEENGTHWKAILEDYDTTTTDGRFTINMMLSFAEAEADRTSDRIRYTFEHKIKNKQPITGAQPYGYKIGLSEGGEKRVVKDDEAAPYVEKIFKHYLQYNSVSATTKYLNNDLDKKICYNTIVKILTNPYYYGHYRGVDDYCPAYIDKETFDKIQEIRTTKNIKTPQTKRVYLFTGLLECPECGNRMCAATKSKRGYPCQFYRCGKCYKQKQCTMNRIFAEKKLEKWLLANLKPELEKYIAEVEIDAPAPVSSGNKSKIIAEMERLNYMFEKNRIPMEEYDLKYSALEKQLQKIEAEKEKPVDLVTLKNFLSSDILELYHLISRVDQRAALRTIIDRIILDRNGNHRIIFLKTPVY